MAVELSIRADQLSKKVKKEPQIILEIPALPNVIFGAFAVTKVVKIGEDDLKIGDGWKIGGVIEDERSKEYISFDGTTKTITQQLIPEKGGVGSVTRLNIRMIDKNEFLTNLFQPGNEIPDILGQRAVAYLNMVGGSHPEDSIKLLDARIDNVDFGAGFVNLKLAAAEQYKRTSILTRIDTTLNGDIDSSTTTIVLNSRADELILPQDSLSSYIIIDDEVIQFTGVSGSTLTGVVRGALETLATSHEDAIDLSSMYRLQDDAITLALKVMLSNGGDYFADDVVVDNINQVNPSFNVSNAISFKISDVGDFYGLVIGDIVDCSGSLIPGNNFTGRAIKKIEKVTGGSYITVDGAALSDEIDSPAVLSFKSQFNTLPEDAGCGMSPQQVDVPRHLEIYNLLAADFPDMDFRLRNTINAQDLVNKEIYFPSGLYQIPRARASVNVTLPPLSGRDPITLDLSTVQNPEKLKVMRSSTDNFYNRVMYRFGYDVVIDELRASYQKTSTDSKDRITVKNRTLNIRSKGLRENARPFIISQSNNFLNRYKFGAESIKSIEINYNEGLRIEVGDSVLLEGSSLRLSDSTQGNRNFVVRLFEVVNKSMSIITGMMKINILDTGYDLTSRFGTVSPSANVKTGSTTSVILLSDIFGINPLDDEAERWERYIGQDILIRSDDYSVSETAVIRRMHPTIFSAIELEAPISFAPTDGYVFETPPYPQTSDITEMDLWKTQHVYLSPQVAVVSGASQTEFTVGVGDINRFFIGSAIRLHNSDYSQESIETEVESILGNAITVKKDLGFTPTSSFVVELIGFLDEGKPYKVI